MTTYIGKEQQQQSSVPTTRLY